MRRLMFNPRTGHFELTQGPTSKAQAKQRAGRVSRTQNGICIRLYAEDRKDLPDSVTPVWLQISGHQVQYRITSGTVSSLTYR